MLSVADALARVTAAFTALAPEQISVAAASGRVLAEDAIARVTQPPVAMSAMDGYAVRAADVATTPAKLHVVGQAPAGGGYDRTLGPGEAVRIFTGGPVPDGADAIVIQENTEADGNSVSVLVAVAKGTYIRPAGLDFRASDVGLRAGKRLTPCDVGLAAAMNLPWLAVRRKPRVALLATGDEIVRPGDPVGRFQIVSSNTLALAALVSDVGGVAVDLGIAHDNEDSLRRMAAGAAGADVLVTTGGASVGDHDLVHSVLGKDGLELDFWRVAMRPGKPLMFGHVQGTPLIGVPGNPVSSLVCGILFLKPAIETMLGVVNAGHPRESARLGRGIDANDERQDYLRARLSTTADGDLVATPFDKQDSSMLSTLADADCFVVRPPHAPPAMVGERIDIMRF